MKNTFTKSTVAIGFVAALAITGCQNDFDNIKTESLPISNDQQVAIQGLAQIEKSIVSNFVTATANLYNGVTTFESVTSDPNLVQLQNLWKLARNPWESNESFAFGPVENEGIDGNSDDWPFDITAFASILNSSQVLDQAYVTQMTTTTKGFHAIEYLLFGLDGAKTATDFTARELLMLDLLTSDLNTQANKLNSSWTTGTTNSFYDAYVSAGAGSDLYPTTQAALGDVLGSMVDITDELPNSKIQIPLTLQSSAYLESRFSDYSYYDYLNNLNGVYAAYTGQYGDITTQKNFSSLVVAANPSVNDKAITQFKLCIALMELIQPASMNQAIIIKQDQLKEIVTELQKLNKILDEDVREVLGL